MPTILVVDDDPDIRQLVWELLRLSGFEATTVASGREALDVLDELAGEGGEGGDALPSLVLLDVQMPDLDGWDTLRAIRGRPELAAVPVVLCTVKSGSTDTALGWTLGCDGYVVKPFAIADLIAEVEAVIGLDEAGRDARRVAALESLAEASKTTRLR